MTMEGQTTGPRTEGLRSSVVAVIFIDRPASCAARLHANKRRKGGAQHSHSRARAYTSPRVFEINVVFVGQLVSAVCVAVCTKHTHTSSSSSSSESTSLTSPLRQSSGAESGISSHARTRVN